jgi:hypothetical protein
LCSKGAENQKPGIFSRKAAKFAVRQAHGHEPLGLELGAERQRRMAKGKIMKKWLEKDFATLREIFLVPR